VLHLSALHAPTFSHAHARLVLTSLRHPERVMRVDHKLEDAIRLCDTREYCDTLTVASDLLKDTDKYLCHQLL
jgi:hypothetical protein